MINIKKFFKDNDIEFDSDKKALRWIRSMRPNTLVRIGSSYFIDEEEINQLMQNYLNQQILTRKRRAAQAIKNFTKSKQKRSSNLKPSN